MSSPSHNLDQDAIQAAIVDALADYHRTESFLTLGESTLKHAVRLLSEYPATRENLFAVAHAARNAYLSRFSFRPLSVLNTADAIYWAIMERTI